LFAFYWAKKLSREVTQEVGEKGEEQKFSSWERNGRRRKVKHHDLIAEGGKKCGLGTPRE